MENKNLPLLNIHQNHNGFAQYKRVYHSTNFKPEDKPKRTKKSPVNIKTHLQSGLGAGAVDLRQQKSHHDLVKIKNRKNVLVPLMSRMAERRHKLQSSPKKLHPLREMKNHETSVSIDNHLKVPHTEDFKAISTITYHPFTQRVNNYHSVAA